MRKKVPLIIVLALLIFTQIMPIAAQPSGLPVDVPREELFIADQITRRNTPGNFNLWVPGVIPGIRQALMMETLWYRDQETGELIHGAAISDPLYNNDYTQLSVDLRDNLYWSDGVQFTADDLVFTVETLMANPELATNGWSQQLNQFVESVEKTSDFSVQFNLNQANPRFHSLFEAVFNGLLIMPKHSFENVADLLTYNYADGPILGAYQPIDFDPNGFWELFERRDDWENTVAGMITGSEGPKYILSILYDDSALKAIAISRSELDVFFDVDFEAFETVLDTTPSARSWYTEFPWAYPNEVNTRMLTFNYESDPLLQNKDVRWALALALDIVDLQTTYIGGVAKVTSLPVPATSTINQLYYDPMEEWFQNLEIEVGDGEMYRPYDPTISDQIAAWANEQGYDVPSADNTRAVFGSGWWKYAPDVAEQLLIKNGFSRDGGGRWLTPDGELFELEVQAPPDEPDAFRIANAAADMWGQFGITVDLQALERNLWQTNLYTGQYQVSVPWISFVTAAGDSWPQIRGLHSDLYVPSGEDSRSTGGSNSMRLQDPLIGGFIDGMLPIAPDDEESVQLTTDLLKHWTENMYSITTISFKKFITWDERYWTGFPTFENPSYQPLYWFQGGKFAIQSLKPAE